MLVNDRAVNPAVSGVERYVGLEHLDAESLRIRRWGDVTDVESTKLRFQPGDIIFGKRRVYQRKLAVADFEGICSAHAMVLRARADVVLPEFLPFFMQSDTFMNRALEISVGSLSPTINWKTLAAEEFALPPIEEQRRLVVVLGAARMSAERASSLVACLNVLLRSATNATAERGIRANQLVALDDLVLPERPICYGILMPGAGFEGGVPVVKVKDYPNGYVNVDDLLLTDPRIDEEYRRSRLRAGDLLVSIRGTIGRLAQVPDSLDGANITQDTARLSIRPEVNTDYVRAMLESSYVKRQIAQLTTGLAVQGINIGELRRVQVPMVDKALQSELVEEVVALRAAIRAAVRREGESAGLLRSLRDRLVGSES